MPRQIKRKQSTRSTTTIRTRSKTQGLVPDLKPVQQARIPLSPKHILTNINLCNDDELLLSPKTTLPSGLCTQPSSQIGSKRGHSDSHLITSHRSSPFRHQSTVSNTSAPNSPSLISPPRKRSKLSTPVNEYIRAPRAIPTPNLSTRDREASFELANTPIPIAPRSHRSPIIHEVTSTLPEISITEQPKSPRQHHPPGTPPQRVHFQSPKLAPQHIGPSSPIKPSITTKLPMKTPVRPKFAFNVPNVCSFSPLTPIPPTPMVKSTSLFGAKKHPGGLFAHLRQSTNTASPRKDCPDSLAKTRIPAPMSSSPQKMSAVLVVRPKQLVNSPLRNKLKQGPRAGAGAREKARLLGSKPSVSAATSAKKFAMTNGAINGRTLTGNLFSSNRDACSSASATNCAPSTPGQRKGNTMRVLDGLGKALERLSLPRPSRPSSALGHRPSMNDRERQVSQLTATGPSLPRSNGVMNFAMLEGNKHLGAGIGKLGLPMRRPGQFKAPGAELEPVIGSPVKPSISTSRNEPSGAKAELEIPLRTPAAPANAIPLAPESSFVFNEADISATSDGNVEPKFSVDDLVLKMNGIAPRVVSDSSPQGQAPTGAAEPPMPTAEEATCASQPRLSNAVRVTEVSRALSMTIAQREDHNLAQKVASERPNRPVRTASIAQRKQHQQSQARQSSLRPAGSLDVLKGCVIYVDIATEDNEDASGLFVDMLKGLGARILSKPSRICTHIIFKNGCEETVIQWRAFPEPRPCVVGIGWVVDCAEKRQRASEKQFEVDLMSLSLVMRKRRKSFSLRANVA